jgi:hypothetical protein
MKLVDLGKVTIKLRKIDALLNPANRVRPLVDERLYDQGSIGNPY